MLYYPEVVGFPIDKKVNLSEFWAPLYLTKFVNMHKNAKNKLVM